MTDREVVYLLSGQAHLPYLVVSLHTLRQHWHGPVRVFAWPESIDIVRRIASDMSLGITAELSDPEYRAKRDEGKQGKNDQFIHKIKLFSSLDDVKTILYLDADTSVHGDLTPLFQAAEKYGFCATRFSSWTTKGGIPQSRITRLKEIECIDKNSIESVLRYPWPSVNGGVWAASPKSPVFKLWYDWTWAARFQFIADEAVLHVLMPWFNPPGEETQMAIWPDGRFNCSVKPSWFPEELTEEEICVWHYHGDSNCRLNKFGGAGVKRWWPLYQECLEQNIGGIAEWGSSIENKWMKSCIKNKWIESCKAEMRNANENGL